VSGGAFDRLLTASHHDQSRCDRRQMRGPWTAIEAVQRRRDDTPSSKDDRETTPQAPERSPAENCPRP